MAVIVLPYGVSGQASTLATAITVYRGDRVEAVPGLSVTPLASDGRLYVVAGLPEVPGADYRLSYPAPDGGLALSISWPGAPVTRWVMAVGVSDLSAADLGVQLFRDGVAQAAPTVIEDGADHYAASGWGSTGGTYSLIWSWGPPGGEIFSAHYWASPVVASEVTPTHTAVVPIGVSGAASEIEAGLDLYRDGVRQASLPAALAVTAVASEPRWYVISGLPHERNVPYQAMIPWVDNLHLEHRWPRPAPSRVLMSVGVTGLTAADLGVTLYRDGVELATPTVIEDASANYTAIVSDPTDGHYSLIWGLDGRWSSWHWVVEPAAVVGDARFREADGEAADAVRELYDDGEPVTVRYAPSYTPEGSGAQTIIAPIEVTTHALFRAFETRDLARGIGTDEIWLAHGAATPVRYKGEELVGLGPLKGPVHDLPSGTAPQASAITVYRGQPLKRGDYPVPEREGVTAWDVLGRSGLIADAGVPIIHKLGARAA